MEQVLIKLIEALISAVNKLLQVKSIITIILTVGMMFLLSGKWNPTAETIALYSTVYGAIITYFFTRKDDKESK